MAELAARKSQKDSDSSLQTQGGTLSGSPHAGDRRVTADSFRQLLSRLKKSADATAAAAPQAEPTPDATHVAGSEPVVEMPAAGHETEAAALPPPAHVPLERQRQLDAIEDEKRKWARAEVHAASQEIIARLRKAAAEQKPAASQSKTTDPQVVPVEAQAATAEILASPVTEAPVAEAPVEVIASPAIETSIWPSVAEATGEDSAPAAVELPTAELQQALQDEQGEAAAAANLAEQISHLRYVESAVEPAEVQPTAAQVEEQELSAASVVDAIVSEPQLVAPATFAPEAGAGDHTDEPAARRRHPFFPDVFVDDEGHIEQPAAEVAAEPVAEFVQVEPVALDHEPIAENTAAETHDGKPTAGLVVAEQVVDAAVEPVALAEPELVEVAEIAPLEQPVAEIVVPEVVATQVEAAVPATTAIEDEAEVDGGHRDDLIEDEADAVKHLHGVEVKGIGDIARAVFSAPTPAERAAFLAEIAAAAQTEEAETAPKEVLAAAPEALAAPQPTARKVAPADDPFAKIAPDISSYVNNEEPDEDSGELARSLLDMMLSGPHAGLPQERALAADALLKLIPKVPTKALITIAERVSLMEHPPHLLIARLINDPRIEISGPLLEQCNHISDQVLGKVIAGGNIGLQRLIARRRQLSPALTDALIGFDDASVILTLVRNAGASFSHTAFNQLVDHASRNEAILAPLATRSDLPAPVAFELFWLVPAQLRRYLLSRFLTDSETLTKILKITKVMQAGSNDGEASDFANKADVDAFMQALVSGQRQEAEVKLAAVAGITPACAARIVGDQQGEPLAIIFKAIGLNRAQFEECITKLQQPEIGIVATNRQVLELLSIFNSMSFNKARILLTYWDWAVQQHGPYASSS